MKVEFPFSGDYYNNRAVLFSKIVGGLKPSQQSLIIDEAAQYRDMHSTSRAATPQLEHMQDEEAIDPAGIADLDEDSELEA